MARIRAVLAEHPEGRELMRFLPTIAADAQVRRLQARATVASTCIAALELARKGVLSLQQEETFGG